MSAPAAGSPGYPRASLLSTGALALVLGALVALFGCGAGAGSACVTARSAGGGPGGCAAGVAGRPSAGTGPPVAGGAIDTVHPDGLVVALTVKPVAVRVGAPVEIELIARAARAPGVVGYLLRYGDGATSGSGAVPQFCLAVAPPVRRVWRTTHRYRAPGRYVVSASVYVNCTRERAVATTRVLVR